MLKIKGLCKYYGDFKALDELDLHVSKGELFGFVGPNGAGKTTTIKIVSGLLTADGGSVQVGEIDALKNNQGLKEKIGYVPDFFGVYDNLRVVEYLEFFASMYNIEGKEAHALIGRLLEQAGLLGKDRNYVDELSRGMKQRLCLARAMIHDPELLILDEPASGLDPRTRHEFKETLKLLQCSGMTILISSHILTELAEMCTSIGIIEKGKMVLQGSIEDIFAAVDSSNPLMITIYKELDKAVAILKKNSFIKSISIRGNVIVATFMGSKEEEAETLKELIENGVYITSFSRERSTLESLFLEITHGNEEGERL